MSNSENKLSKAEQTRLAFEGLLDMVGATALGEMIADADGRLEEVSAAGLDGVYIEVPPEDDGNYEDDGFFATTVQVVEKHVSVQFGGAGEAYSLPKPDVASLIDQRLAEEQQAPPNA